MEIQYIKQPTEYLCGQACVAMLANVSVDEVIEVMQNDKGTGKKELAAALGHFGIPCSKTMTKADNNTKLPDTCILKVLLPKYGHWVYTMTANIMIRNLDCLMNCTPRNEYSPIVKFIFELDSCRSLMKAKKLSDVYQNKG